MQIMCHLGGYTLIKRFNPRQIYMRKEGIMEAQCVFLCNVKFIGLYAFVQTT